MKKSLILLPFMVSAISCSSFQRHQESGYSGVRKTSTNKRSSDSSMNASPAKTSEKVRLQNLENSLSTKKEIEQYSKMLPYFKSDEERITFLNQGNFEAKQTWLNENNFLNRPQTVTSEMRELVEAQDITLGMPQFLVKKSWGEPDLIEVSGNPSFRNERWRYSRYVSTNDGYKPEKKVVYFEGGRVVGWEVE